MTNSQEPTVTDPTLAKPDANTAQALEYTAAHAAALVASHEQLIAEIKARHAEDMERAQAAQRRLEEAEAKVVTLTLLHEQALAHRDRAEQDIKVLKLSHEQELQESVEQGRQKANREWTVRSRYEALERNVETAHLKALAEAAEARSFNLQNSTSFQVGAQLLAALRNPLKLLAFPANALRAHRATRNRKNALRAKGSTLTVEQSSRIRDAYGFKALEGAYKVIDTMDLDPTARAAAFSIVERCARAMIPETGFLGLGDGSLTLSEKLALSSSNVQPRLLGPMKKPVIARKPAAALSTAKSPQEALIDFLELADPAALVEAYRQNGAPFVIARVRAHFRSNRRDAAREMLRMLKVLRDNNVFEAEFPLAEAAAKLDRSENVLRALFWAYQRTNQFLKACDVMFEVNRLYGASPTAVQLEFAEKMQRSPAFQLSLLKLIAKNQPIAFEPIPKRLCYVLHNTLPYSSGGYATRSHGVLTGIRDAGWDVVALSRPGFPLDIKHELTEDQISPVDVVDGVSYVRVLSPRRAGMSAFDYMYASAEALEVQMKELRPSLVMAASNHVTGLPALIAASRLGIPFVYEIRGLWEITRVSREPTFEDNAAFHVQRVLEASVTKGADHAFTLTEPMREELIARGVDAHKLDLLPNSCDPSRFQPRGKDEALMERLGIPANVPVIGYVGTFVDYEGLEDLAEACALLKKRGTEFRLLMVGNENASAQMRGPITEWIDRVAKDNGFADWTILTGRVPHEEVESYYSLIDVCPFPRKPWPVCEMVSPMKPLEALAMEKAVVVSSVRALVEMIKDGETGLVFEKGNIESLADTLQRMIDDPEMRARMGKTGRQWVENERTWTQVGVRFANIAETVLAERQVAIAAQ